MHGDGAPADGTGRVWRGHCLPPDQRVLTPDGYRPISAVDARESVVTGLGRVRLVVAVQSRDADELLYHLRTERGNLLRATGEHPVLARVGEDLPEWVPAARLRAGHLVAIFGTTALGGWWPGGQTSGGPAGGPEEGLKARPADGAGQAATTAVREEAEPYVGLDWVPLASVEAAPYRGLVYDLDVEEDHSFVSEGLVLSACTVE